MTERLDDLDLIEIAKARAKETPVKVSINELSSGLPPIGAERGKRERGTVYQTARRRT